MEAICEATVLLMYTTCLVLRNEDQRAWDDEWVSRDGYGWMLVMMYVLICPSPMFYSLYRRLQGEEGAPPEVEFGEEIMNPLGDAAASDSAAGLALVTSNDQRARAANQQQRKAKLLAAELAKAKDELSKLKAKTAATEGAGGVDSGVAYSLDTRRASQVTQLKDLVESGIISEEALEKAKSNFDSHVKGSIEQQQIKIVSESRAAGLGEGRRSLREFLAGARLLRYEDGIVDVLGEEAAAEDLQLLNAQDITFIKANMTRVEALRFEKLIQTPLRSDTEA